MADGPLRCDNSQYFPDNPLHGRVAQVLHDAHEQKQHQPGIHQPVAGLQADAVGQCVDTRVDVYLPEGTWPLVAEGQTAIAGETVLADFRIGDGGRTYRVD